MYMSYLDKNFLTFYFFNVKLHFYFQQRRNVEIRFICSYCAHENGNKDLVLVFHYFCESGMDGLYQFWHVFYLETVRCILFNAVCRVPRIQGLFFSYLWNISRDVDDSKLEALEFSLFCLVWNNIYDDEGTRKVFNRTHFRNFGGKNIEKKCLSSNRKILDAW